MKNGWTGGQYSVFRAVFGLCLALRFAQLLVSGAGLALPAAAGLLLAVCLALGVADRLAALALCALWAWLFTPDPRLGNPSLLFVCALLLAHAAILGKPYGAWSARGRADPGGGWRLPGPTFAAAWIVLAASYAWSGWVALAGGVWPIGGALGLALELGFAPAALFPRLRPFAWLALLALQLARALLADPAVESLGWLLLHAFCFDPAWLPPRRDAAPARLFYDGHCGLCHRAVRFVLAEDPSGTALRFAPLASAAFAALVPERERAALPDSLVLVTPDARVLVRSSAVLELCERLGGLWRALALALRLVPTVWLDRAYDAIASVRQRLFTRPEESCPLVAPELRARFD